MWHPGPLSWFIPEEYKLLGEPWAGWSLHSWLTITNPFSHLLTWGLTSTQTRCVFVFVFCLIKLIFYNTTFYSEVEVINT